MHAERPLAARLGGDEFTVLVPDVACAEDAQRLGRRLLRALSEPYEIAGHSVEIGASIGIALHSENSRGLTTLMRNADLRSEEHTSELQSLMRISYAVFCLKNNKIQHPNTHTE